MTLFGRKHLIGTLIAINHAIDFKSGNSHILLVIDIFNNQTH